jgi:hypothetical protein
MAGTPETEHEAICRRVREKIDSVPPGDKYMERVLDKLHGPGWKERAMAAGPLTLQYGRRLRELELRVSRIERQLNPSPKPLDWPKQEPIALIEPLKREPKGE